MSHDCGKHHYPHSGAGPAWSEAGTPPPGPGFGRRVDMLDVVEGVLRDGFSLSNFTRIARASGSNFWVGAAIGASAVVLARRPEVRSAVSGIFRPHKPETGESASR